MVTPDLPLLRDFVGAGLPGGGGSGQGEPAVFADGEISPVSFGDSALACSNTPESESEACLRELAEHSAEFVLAATKGGGEGCAAEEREGGHDDGLDASAFAPPLHSALHAGFHSANVFALGPSNPALGLAHGHNHNHHNNHGNNHGSAPRPEWQKICIQHSVCIHNIYGNCAYGDNCYYNHLENFSKPDLLFKTELCRYGVDCVNSQRCCFAHSATERRTPELNIVEALQHNPIRFSHTSPSKPAAPHRHAVGAVADLGGPSEMKRRFERQQQALRAQMGFGSDVL